MPEASPMALNVDLYAKSFLIRGVEQRLLDLFAQGKLFGTVHTCIGQEWTGVAIAAALHEDDILLSNHRGHGHYLARTDDVNGLLAEIMGKQNGVCGGRGGSQHLYTPGFYSNGIQGGMMPVAAGMAFAERLRQGEHIVAIFIGDGTLGEGTVYETLNIAAKWGLPLLVMLENNRYSQSTAQHTTLAGEILDRPQAFGIKTSHADTWHPDALVAEVAACVEYVRLEKQPCFLQIDTYRLMAHSKSDDDRDPAEIQHHWSLDPLCRYQEASPEESARINAEVMARIDAAVARAESAPFAADDIPDAQASPHCPVTWRRWQMDKPERLVNLLRAALQRNMQRDERIILFGEDIQDPYGGAFKVTKTLTDQFPGRVYNTPISEAAIVGLGNGLALAGMLPICEIMFGDFMSLTLDQILNHAAKFRYMYNDQVRVPLIVRTPMGGKRGYGPTHSQSIEKHFLGIPGSLVLALHTRHDAGGIYDTLLAHIDRPTLVIENKSLYAQQVQDKAPDGFVWEQSDERYPTTRLRPLGKADLTILCYGGLLPDAEAAAEELFYEHEVISEVICPTQLYPLNIVPLLESVSRSGRLLIVEEGPGFAAFGAEAVAQLAEHDPAALQALHRVCAPEHPIPTSGPLERAQLPSSSHILRAALELMRHE